MCIRDRVGHVRAGGIEKSREICHHIEDNYVFTALPYSFVRVSGLS